MDDVSLDMSVGNRNTLRYMRVSAHQTRRDVESVNPEHLDTSGKSSLASVLHDHASLFKGGIDQFPGPEMTVEAISPPLKPYYRKPYRTPHALINDVKTVINKMVDLGVLKPNFDSPWGSPTLAFRKPSGDICIVTDFRQVSLLLRRKPYPMPNIAELFQQIDGYDYAWTLDLYLGFHHVLLSAYASNIFTAVLPWGKYVYTRMPLGYTGAPNVFQHHMDQILGDLSCYVRFIDDIAIWTKGSYEDHLKHVNTVLDRLVDANIRLNLPKCNFLAEELKYLGFLFTKQGI
jgi:hypothetical protein